MRLANLTVERDCSHCKQCQEVESERSVLMAVLKRLATAQVQTEGCEAFPNHEGELCVPVKRGMMILACMFCVRHVIEPKYKIWGYKARLNLFQCA